jgi:menaquinol-cytochrome c reductase iron-sulfur subunit
MDRAILEPRRRFLEWVVALGAAGIGAIAGIPLLGAIVYPLRARTVREDDGFLDVGKADNVNADAPTKATVLATRWDSWARIEGVELGTVWLTRDPSGAIVAFSSICPHLGCSVDYLADSKIFNCPCHGTVFRPDGSVVSGPAPRALDRLACKVEGGRVLVKFQRFAVGTREQRTA